MLFENKNALSQFIVDGAPSEWLSFAEELMDSAEILWEQGSSIRSDVIYSKDSVYESRKVLGISRTYFLLVGFAVENLLKGLIVFNDPTTITNGRIKKINTHKITELVTKADVDLSEEEFEICKIIEDAIPYWGRYPIPLKSTDVTPDVGITFERRTIIKTMYARMALSLYDKVKDGWESGTGEYSQIMIPKYEKN